MPQTLTVSLVPLESCVSKTCEIVHEFEDDNAYEAASTAIFGNVNLDLRKLCQDHGLLCAHQQEIADSTLLDIKATDNILVSKCKKYAVEIDKGTVMTSRVRKFVKGVRKGGRKYAKNDQGLVAFANIFALVFGLVRDESDFDMFVAVPIDDNYRNLVKDNIKLVTKYHDLLKVNVTTTLLKIDIPLKNRQAAVRRELTYENRDQVLLRIQQKCDDFLTDIDAFSLYLYKEKNKQVAEFVTDLENLLGEWTDKIQL